MEIRVLGPVEAWAAGRQVEIGAPRQRAVLAAIAVDVGRPVLVDDLVDRIWGEHPPQRARHALYVYIARLRRALAESDGRLVRRSGGYLLDADADLVDLHRFRSLIAAAHEPRRTDTDRSSLSRRALTLWRGTPLGDIGGDWADRSREGWRQLRLDAAVTWAQAELRLGNAGAVVGPLTQLIEEYPLAEPLVVALMRALYASGNAAQALENYAVTRQSLIEQLGADPGPELRELHAMILRGDAADPAHTPPAVPTGPEAPALLPPDVPGFAGRDRELALLDAILAGAGEHPTALPIVALSGTAGVGKTTLAVHWAHRVAERFPDGQLYVNLRGFDPSGTPLPPAEAVRGFLEALAVPPDRVPAGQEARVGLYRSILAGRRVLVILDNARDAEQVRPLLPGAPGCLVVVTSRDQLTGLVAVEGARPIALQLLSATESRQLLVRRLGAQCAVTEPGALDEVITHCARLPLALAVVAARAATQPLLPLSGLARELRDAVGGLDAFDGGDASCDVRSVFSWSYRSLSPHAAQLFRLLGLHPGAEIAVPAAASLVGVPGPEVVPVLAELTRAHLVGACAVGRYTLHDLLRAYAAELTLATDTAVARHAALHRVLDHYLHTAYGAARLLEPHREPITLCPPRPGVVTVPITDPGAALAWFATEHVTLTDAVARAADAALATHTWQLAWSITSFSNRRGHWHDQAVVNRVALDAVCRTGDLVGQASSHRGLARAYFRLGRHEDAETHLRRAVMLAEELGDLPGHARAHHGLATVLEHRRAYVEALRHAEKALALYVAAGHGNGQAEALNGVGWCHALMGDYRRSLACAQRALPLLRKFGDRHAEGSAWDTVGYAYAHLGRHKRAITCYERALRLFREVGERFLAAETLTHLGDVHQLAGDLDGARRAWREALTILDQLGHANAAQVRAKLGGTPTGDGALRLSAV